MDTTGGALIAMEKPPYFPFYVGDFLASRAVAQLSLEQIGAYTLLLCWQWDDPTCSLPADAGILGYLSRLGDRWATVGQDIVSLCFEKRGKRIFNNRLRAERSKYDAKVSAGREGGIRSGQSRRKGSEAKPKQAASKTEREAKQKGTIQNQSQIQSQRTATTDFRPVAAAPVAASGEPPPTAATPSEARVLALQVLGPKPKAHATWLTAPGDLWRARWGEESEPPFGEMSKWFEKPRKAFEGRGELDLLWNGWERFLAAAETSQWARPMRFVQGLGEWIGTNRAPPTRGHRSVDERAMDGAREAIEAHRARGGK